MGARTTTAQYKGLFIENRKGDEFAKHMLEYDQSLKRLRDKGFERHLRPSEAFSLVFERIEGKLEGDLFDIACRMTAPYSWGEWHSMAFERRGSKLIVYLDPEGLIYVPSYVMHNNKKYRTSVTYKTDDSFRYSEKKEFDINGLLYLCINLVDFHRFAKDNPNSAELIRYIFGRGIEDIPEIWKKSGSISLPEEQNVIWPIGLCTEEYGHVIGCWEANGASRGVIPIR